MLVSKPPPKKKWKAMITCPSAGTQLAQQKKKTSLMCVFFLSFSGTQNNPNLDAENVQTQEKTEEQTEKEQAQEFIEEIFAKIGHNPVTHAAEPIILHEKLMMAFVHYKNHGVAKAELDKIKLKNIMQNERFQKPNRTGGFFVNSRRSFPNRPPLLQYNYNGPYPPLQHPQQAFTGAPQSTRPRSFSKGRRQNQPLNPRMLNRAGAVGMQVPK